mgnify:FL=1
MPHNIFHNPTLVFLVGVSFFGLFLVPMFASHPPTEQNPLFWRKPLVGLIYGLVCLLGILAVFSPKKCSGVSHFEKHPNELNNSRKSVSKEKLFTIVGHHPNCGNFSAHIFQIGNAKLCSSCTGLFLGALGALAGTAMYFFGNWHIAQVVHSLLWVGILGVASGLLQYLLFNVGKSFVRLFLNSVFVLGTFLILIGLDELTQSLATDLFIVLMSVFWLYTRISLSEWNHERVCYYCKVVSCRFRK